MSEKRPAARVRAAILAAPWAMTPEMVQTLLSIAERDNLSPEAVAAELGRPLDNTRLVTVRDGVATIPIEGTIVRHADLFVEISGGVSIDALATDLRAALDNPGVHSIVLAIDSFGGEANGVNEFAAMVRAADAVKPVVAYIGGAGASAGYYIASAAGEVVIAADALVGSIGVILAVPDPEKASSRSVAFVSSQSPHKRPDPHSEGGRSRLQGLVDDTADIFINAVAAYRGLTTEQVTAAEGMMLVGQQAVDAGLADRVGSYEGVVAELQARAREPRRIGTSGRMAAQGGSSMADEQKQPGFWTKFWSNLGAQMDTDPTLAPQWSADAARLTAEPGAVTLSAPMSAADAAEIERLRAQVARMQAAERTRAEAEMATRATAFADAEIRASRALPAEREALMAAYTDAATDDLAHPREGQPSRVARLEERQQARPASGHLGELVPVRPEADGSLTPLANLDKTAFVAGEEADAPLTLERRIQIMAMTDLGRAELKRQGIPIPAVPAQP